MLFRSPASGKSRLKTVKVDGESFVDFGEYDGPPADIGGGAIELWRGADNGTGREVAT